MTKYFRLFYPSLTIKNNFRRYIDHGKGVLTLRIEDPFTLDSGVYKCVISTLFGDVSSECEVEIEEFYDGNIFDIVPEFVKTPLPTISFLNGSASFCCRVTPIDSNVVWSICGKDVSDDRKEFKVSEIPF